MLKLSELLTRREKRLLLRLSLEVLFVVAVFIFSLIFWSSRLKTVNQESAKLQAELEKMMAQAEQTEIEFLRWQETQKDLEEMKKTVLYSGQGSLEAFRQDLTKLFQQAGLLLTTINYQYEESERKEFNKLSASFNLRLLYPHFKKFLYLVETWPRFLVLDQINFQKIDNVSGILDLRLTLAGYYHEGKHEEKQ
jgi:Tfp pilus assembly protein PilO